MNNADDWVSINLQRQRQILEEKQRQRRMQSSGVVQSSTAFARPPRAPSSPTATTNVPVITRSTSMSRGFPPGDTVSKTTFGYESNVLRTGRGSSYGSTTNMNSSVGNGSLYKDSENPRVGKGSSYGSSMNSRSSTHSMSNSNDNGVGLNYGNSINSSLYSFVNGSGTSTTYASSLNNSMYSMMNGNNGDSVNSSLYSMINGESQTPRARTFTNNEPVAPKIITVKGFIPSETQKESKNENISSHLSSSISYGPQRPIVNVDRLERINLCDSTHFTNSETEEDGNPSRSSALNKVDKKIPNPNGEPFSEHIHQKRYEPWEEFDYLRRPGQSGVNEAGENSFKGATRTDGPDDLESIPTEIVNEENPIGLINIYNNLDQFVMQPTKKNSTLKCTITRDKKGVDKGMFPIYYLYKENPDGKRMLLLAARRRKKSTTANYLISTDATDLSRSGRSCVAKIRSNAMGTSFTIYDKGANPKNASAICEEIRQELAVVTYETNVLGLRGPRKMVIIIPAVHEDKEHNFVRAATIRPLIEKDSMLERYKTHRLDDMQVLYNKQPIWSEESQSYVLNFHGRVTQASVKNFQIIQYINGSNESNACQSSSQKQNSQNLFASEQNEYIVMQFGRNDSDNFKMDVRFPLSPVQAFGIAMTSFHKKLACD